MFLGSGLNVEQSYKVILVGDSSVGKSSLIHRFKNDSMEERLKTTVGVEFNKRILKYRKTNQAIQIHLWDTAGQERYRSITKQHYRGADAALIVFDFGRDSTFNSIETWIREVRENVPSECVLSLVGNKADIKGDERNRLADRARELARENNMIYFETSSLWGRQEEFKEPQCKGIESIVLDLAEAIIVHNPKKGLHGAEFESLRDDLYSVWSMCDDRMTTPRPSSPFSRFEQLNSTAVDPNNAPIVLVLSGKKLAMTKESKNVCCF